MASQNRESNSSSRTMSLGDNGTTLSAYVYTLSLSYASNFRGNRSDDCGIPQYHLLPSFNSSFRPTRRLQVGRLPINKHQQILTNPCITLQVPPMHLQGAISPTHDWRKYSKLGNDAKARSDSQQFSSHFPSSSIWRSTTYWRQGEPPPKG
jgi:hypothetical protein